MLSTADLRQPTTFGPLELESAVDEERVSVTGAPAGNVKVRIVRPKGAHGVLPVILFIHGAHTHDRLVRELAAGTGAAVVFPECSAVEESYAVARWIVREGFMHRLDASRAAIAGDSVGGNMAASLTILAKQRGDVEFKAQVLFYPVTEAGFDTESDHRFAEGYRLAGLPKALVINGEAYARNLRAAGLDVTAIRFSGAIDDFVTADALRETNAAGAAIRQAIVFLKIAIAK